MFKDRVIARMLTNGETGKASKTKSKKTLIIAMAS